MVLPIQVGGLMSRSNLRFADLAVIGLLVAALGLAGCGRKAGLDPPPAAAASTQDPIAPADAPPVIGPDGKPMAPPANEKKQFFLDWLLN